MKYQSEKCFSIIGFSDANMMRRSLYLGDTVYEVIAEPNYEVNNIFLIFIINVFVLFFLLGRNSSICWSCSSNV
jgi:hypothetical protein